MLIHIESKFTFDTITNQIVMGEADWYHYYDWYIFMLMVHNNINIRIFVSAAENLFRIHINYIACMSNIQKTF